MDTQNNYEYCVNVEQFTKDILNLQLQLKSELEDKMMDSNWRKEKYEKLNEKYDKKVDNSVNEPQGINNQGRERQGESNMDVEFDENDSMKYHPIRFDEDFE